ncbi:MAG: hypothetical protein JNL60_15880 [Bacteroidia bacterium]|nr:hypothetical protein [Bacteroidia bacterium]
MKRVLLSIILCFIILVSSDCKKKIAKHPFEMEGVWCSDDFLCTKILVIENNSQGKLFAADGGFCMSTSEVKGKVKYKKDILYIDGKRFEIFDGPKYASGNDSILAPDENNFSSGTYRMRKVLATMIIKPKGLATLNESYQLSKYIDY